MHLRHRAAGVLLAVLMLAAILPTASARLIYYEYQITDKASVEIPAMLEAISAQTFSTTDAATVRSYIEYFLFDSQYAAIGGSRWPYTNSQGYWSGKTVTDGVYTKVVSSTGCMSYSKFVTLVVYGVQGSAKLLPESVGQITASGLKTFLQTYAQAGEHLRIDSRHSVTYISGTEDGFYYMDYSGDYSPYIGLRYTSYSNFAAYCNGISKKVWLYDSEPAVNTGESAQPAEILSSSEWFYDTAMAAEELGLVQGGDAVTYNSSLTMAEAATFCARVHSLLTVGGVEFEPVPGEAWYAPYTAYLMQQGILSEEPDWTAQATREQFISLMFAATPEDAKLSDRCPNVSFVDGDEIEDLTAIEAFCRAGILTGISEEDGLHFYPDSAITRAEAATIAIRLADPSLRVSR